MKLTDFAILVSVLIERRKKTVKLTTLVLFNSQNEIDACELESLAFYNTLSHDRSLAFFCVHT